MTQNIMPCFRWQLNHCSTSIGRQIPQVYCITFDLRIAFVSPCDIYGCCINRYYLDLWGQDSCNTNTSKVYQNPSVFLLQFLQRGTTYVTPSLLPWITNSFELRSTLTGKNLLPEMSSTLTGNNLLSEEGSTLTGKNLLPDKQILSCKC